MGEEGLAAKYRNGRSFDNPTVSRIDSMVNFSWGPGGSKAELRPHDIKIIRGVRHRPRRCKTFIPLVIGAPPKAETTYTVRLHFAELDEAESGKRIFDVKIQDQTLLEDFNIFNDPPTQAEIDGSLRTDRNHLTTGEKIALGPGVLGLEVLVGAAVDAFNGESNFITGKNSPWESQPGAIAWDWSKSIFTESYAKKVRAMNRDLVRGEVAAMTRQLHLE